MVIVKCSVMGTDLYKGRTACLCRGNTLIEDSVGCVRMFSTMHWMASIPSITFMWLLFTKLFSGRLNK